MRMGKEMKNLKSYITETSKDREEKAECYGKVMVR